MKWSNPCQLDLDMSTDQLFFPKRRRKIKERKKKGREREKGGKRAERGMEEREEEKRKEWGERE